MKALFRLPVFLILLAFSFPAFAQDGAIGTFMEVEGAAFITHAGQKTAAAVDAPIYLGDRIETAADSKADILFIDDTDITLGENASLSIDEYVFDEDAAAGSNKGRYSLLRGAFLFTSGLMTKNPKPDVTLETGYGSIGLRGTTVWGGQLDDEYGVLVQEGEVTVTTSRGRIRVPAGTGTNIRSRDSIPTFAAAWGQEKIDRAKGMVRLKRHELVQQRMAARKEKNRELRQQKMEKRGGAAPEQKQGMRDETKEQLDQSREQIRNRREQFIEKMNQRQGERKENLMPQKDRPKRPMAR